MLQIKQFLFLVLFVSSLIDADMNKKIDLEQLSHDRTWLHLLYYDQEKKKSEILSDDYFLSEAGAIDPLAELQATVEGYSQDFDTNSSEHPRCRFPARYMWLNSKIELDDYHIVDSRCENLAKSLEKTSIDSISLMYVSGYLENPASSFGHSFLKLNKKGISNTSTDLFDLAISYGADVPNNENIFLYMYRGLFGKYSARFTDKYFYSQDLVYSSTEFRDIWEYELKLPAEKVLFFQLHVWEILNKKFNYLFLNKNCGYEVTKMVELVLDTDIATGTDLWFAPIETFHKLSDEHKDKIKEIIYHPSEQKKIYQKYYALSIEQQEAAASLVKNNITTEKGKYQDLDDAQKIEVIDFVIAYYTYLLTKERDNKEYEELKRKALLLRFMLPVKREKETIFTGTVVPNQNDRPSMLFLNYNTSESEKNYFSFGYAPYTVQSLGTNNLRGNELTVLKTEIGLLDRKLFLEEFTLISIKNFDRYSIPIEGDSRYTWKLDIGVKNQTINNGYDFYLSGGVGKTYSPVEWFLAYAMINTSIHSYKSYLELTPELGCRIDLHDIKSLLSYQRSFDLVNKEAFNKFEWQANMKLHKDFSLYIQLESTKTYSVSGGIQYYF